MAKVCIYAAIASLLDVRASWQAVARCMLHAGFEGFANGSIGESSIANQWHFTVLVKSRAA